jgi:hypothetical protein
MGVAVGSSMTPRTVPLRSTIPPSKRLDHWLPAAPFRDTISVRSSAPAKRLMQELMRVTLRDMPLANLLGKLRYLPTLLGSAEARRRVRMDATRPFLDAVSSGKGSVVLEQSPDELVLGTIGKLHQIRDQEPADIRTGEQFVAFAEPDHEKLAMSLRVIADGAQTLLVLEHRTRPVDAQAERRFRRYWKLIRPGGAFVTRQLLLAARRRAEHSPLEPRAASPPSLAG